MTSRGFCRSHTPMLRTERRRPARCCARAKLMRIVSIHLRRRPSVAVLLLLRKTRSAPKLRPIRPLRSARPSAARSRQTQSAQSMGGTQLLGQILQQRDRPRDPGLRGRASHRKEILGRVPAGPDARHTGFAGRKNGSFWRPTALWLPSHPP